MRAAEREREREREHVWHKRKKEKRKNKYKQIQTTLSVFSLLRKNKQIHTTQTNKPHRQKQKTNARTTPANGEICERYF